MGKSAGLDVGTKTIGVSVGDALGILASPRFTLERKGVKKDVAKLAPFLTEENVETVVVGLPLELDGTEARSAKLARQIGEAVRAEGFTVVYIDERYTSVDAARRMITAGLKKKRRKAIIDQAAAVLILQSFLDHPEIVES